MRRRWIAAGLAAGTLVAAVLDQDAGLRAWWRVHSELEATRDRVAGLRREVRALRSEARALRNDPFALEAAIREDLGLARPGETVLLLEGADAPSDPGSGS